ncbi:putative uncharacterized protein [Mycoplasma sp. CAG:776]|nr:putative uncharacterized protein [Mycoplasma sp. CAG:776]
MSSSEVTLITGDNGVNVNGDNNILNLYQQPIKYELLSKLCRDLIGSNLSFAEDMNISQLPIELLEKIEFNNLISHKELYEDLGMYLVDIDDIVNKSLGNKSIKLIRIIKTLYLEILTNNPDYTGDQLLFSIENKLMEHTSLIDNQEYFNEDIRYSICQIVLYVFEKCQILKKPTK